MFRPNEIIVMGGGPTAVINQTLLGIFESWKKNRNYGKLFGAINGVHGLINENLINLRKTVSKWKKDQLKELANTPSAALGTARFDIEKESKKQDIDYFEKIFDVLEAHRIRCLYFIGGEDSRKNTYHISEYAKRHGIKISVIHVPKTIDNDLTYLHHCPGFASAAKFIVYATIGTDLDNKATGGVMIDIVMGRNTGWLAATSMLSRRNAKNGPHLIFVPEITFSIDSFLLEIQETMGENNRAHIVVAEGIAESPALKEYMVKFLGLKKFLTLSTENLDSFGHPQLSGSGILGAVLVNLVKTRLKIKRVRAILLIISKDVSLA